MESVRSTTSCQCRRRRPGPGGSATPDVSRNPPDWWGRAGVTAVLTAPVCPDRRGRPDSTRLLWSHLATCPPLPTAETLLPTSGFLKEPWEGRHWEKISLRDVKPEFSLKKKKKKKPSSGNFQVVFHLKQNGFSRTLSS